MGGIKQYDKNKWIYFSFDLEYNLIKNKKKITNACKWGELTKPHFDKNKNSVGIITGEKSNLLILDYDNKKHWKEDIKHNPELLNYYVKTNRGFHSYFLYSDGLNNISRDLKKNQIDLQGDKKFIIAPPSKYKIDDEIIKYKIKSNNDLKFISNDLINYMIEKYKTNDQDIKDEKTNSDIIKMGNLINIKYLDNYDDWLKIIWSLKSENYYEEAKIISSRSKKYDPETFDKYYNSSKDNKITIGTFNYFVKHSNSREYDRINNKKIKTELKTDFNITNFKSQKYMAEVFYNMNKDKYILSDDAWYEYNNYNILKYRCDKKEYPNELLNILSEDLIKYVDEEYNKLDDEKILIEKEYKKIIINLNSSNFLDGIKKFLRGYYYIEDFNNKLNKNINVLCFNNKLYDYDIKDFRNVEKKDYISITTGYDAPTETDEKTLKEIDNLLWSIFEDVELIEYYKIINGLSLFTNKLQSLYIHAGTGSNGKGILNNIMSKCLNEYMGTCENNFLTSTYKSGSPNPSLYNSKNKKYLSLSEPDNGESNCKFNIDLIKTLTGGDAITCRGLFKDNITYIPQFSIHIQLNNKPNLAYLDNGILRRIKIIKYPNSFVDKPCRPNERLRDYNLIDKIKDQKFINNYIIMLIKTAEKYKDIDYKKLPIPQSVQDETNDYVNENNPLLGFIENSLIITNNNKDRVRTSEIFKLYNEDIHTEIKLNQKDILKYMKFNNIMDIKSRGCKYYTGIKLKEQEPMEIEDDTDELNMIY